MEHKKVGTSDVKIAVEWLAMFMTAGAKCASARHTKPGLELRQEKKFRAQIFVTARGVIEALSG